MAQADGSSRIHDSGLVTTDGSPWSFMMMTLRMFLKESLAILMLVGLCACHPYVLPTPDGGGPPPSPPSLVGRIVAISPGAITINPQKSTLAETDVLRVELTAQTAIFTEDGGYVPVERLSAGQSVSIWFVKGEHGGKTTFPLAASILIHPSTP